MMLHWIVLGAVFALSSVARAASVPRIEYRTSAGPDERRLIFSNNPEEIRAEYGSCDLADAWAAGVPCGRSLLRLENMLGTFRDWWEHANHTGLPIRYAVRLVNPGFTEARVVVQGAGFVEDAVRDGGYEFVDLFRGVGATRFTVPPGASRLLFLSEPIFAGNYFAGVVDFEVSGAALTVENLAFFYDPAPETSYLGYERRVRGRVHESLVYKGFSYASRAEATGVNFTIDDSDAPQRLPVSYPRYWLPEQAMPPVDEGACAETAQPPCGGDVGRFEEAPPSDSWITHIGPEPSDPNPKRARSVVSDMVTFFMPGFPANCRVGRGSESATCVEISPFFKWFYPDLDEWKYPNLGNWAVHYRLEGLITNLGRKRRLVHLGLRGDGNSPLAYRAQGEAWSQFVLRKADPDNPGDYFPYGEFTVRPGESLPYSGELILSGPATGTLENLVVLVR